MIMDIPALGRDSVIFESFSFISLDSIMDSIDSSQIPVLIGRSQRRRPEGAEEHPPRRLFPGWGSRGRAFNSGLAGQMARTRDADADQCAVCRKPALLSAVSPHGSSLRHSLAQLPGDALPPLSRLSPPAAMHSRPFDPAAVRLDCPFVPPRG